MFLGDSTLFGLQTVDALGIIKITYNRPATHFTDDRFVNQGFAHKVQTQGANGRDFRTATGYKSTVLTDNDPSLPDNLNTFFFSV